MYGETISAGSTSRYSKKKFETYDVDSALYCLLSFERAKNDAAAIRANKPLMKAVQQLAAKRLAEKQAEDNAMKALAKSA